MRNATCQPIVRQLLAHIEAGTPIRSAGQARIPAHTYTSPDHLQREREVLFRELPQLAGLSADLPEPGSVLTRDRLGPPVVLTRDRGGRFHALANVCAHRGSQVVAEGRDCLRRLVCPYHAWSYELDGTQVALPDAASFPEIALPRPGLRALPAAEQHGLLWVTPGSASGAAAAPQPALGALADDFDAFGLERLRHWRSHRFQLELNWKLVLDTFLEGYHFASLHRATVAPLFVPNLGVAERFGRHLREVLPRRTLVELAEQPPESWDVVPHSAIVYVLFPNTILVSQLDHIETWRCYPHESDPGRCVCDLDFYVPDEPATDSSERHWENNWNLTVDTVIREDFAAMAGVQRGLASGVLDAVTVGANEPALALYHAALAEAL